MRMNEYSGRDFVHEVKRAVPGIGRRKKRLIKQMEEDVRTYIAENPDSDYQALITRFGTPSEIAASYIQETEAKELAKSFRIRKQCVFAFIAAMCLIVLLWVGVVCSAMSDHISNDGGYIVEEFIDISSDIQEEGE